MTSKMPEGETGQPFAKSATTVNVAGNTRSLNAIEAQTTTVPPAASIRREAVQQLDHAKGEDYDTKQQTARRLQIQVRTLDEWMRRGLVPFIKAGRTVRFIARDVDAYLAQ